MIDDIFMRTTPLLANTAIQAGLRFLRYFANVLIIVSLVIHFVVKDRIAGLSFIYYSTPMPVLLIFTFILGIIWLFCKKIRFARFYFILAMGCLLLWFCESFSLVSRAPSSSDLTLFFWNAARNRSKAEEATKYIQNFHPDLIGIVEAGITRKGRQNSKIEEIWRRVFSGYTVEVLPYEMALVTKGKILAKTSGMLAERGHYNLIQISLNGELFDVLLIDIYANPSRSRAPAFAQLTSLIRSYSSRNLVVMGDFNTPAKSVFFEPFRKYLNQTFEAGGVGFAETWPIPLPVLALDQIWVSKKITVISCRLNWSWFSDHRSVVAGIELPQPSHLQMDQ